jgi:hypothetical protein
MGLSFTFTDQRTSGRCERLKRVDIDTVVKALSMSEQHSGAKRGIVIILVIGFRQPDEGFRIEPVLDMDG